MSMQCVSDDGMLIVFVTFGGVVVERKGRNRHFVCYVGLAQFRKIESTSSITSSISCE